MGELVDDHRQMAELSRYPLPSLESLAELSYQDLACLGTEQELQTTKQALTELLAPDGTARKLQARLEAKDNDPSVQNWADNFHVFGWLRNKNKNYRERNFSLTPFRSKSPHSQAERAALWTLTAYAYKLRYDAGDLPQEYDELNLPQCMNSLNWLFNSARVPRLNLDESNRWPGNDYIVAMRNGHAYKIPLLDTEGQVLSHQKLKRIFQAIVEKAPAETSWLSILTSDYRDKWAEIQQALIAHNPLNGQLVSMIHKSLFVVCLEDSSPETDEELFQATTQDDGRNRWLDKTVTFVVQKNGESSMHVEHTRVDARGAYGLLTTLHEATVDHVEDTTSDVQATLSPEDYTYYPAIIPAHLEPDVLRLRNHHHDNIAGWKLYKYTHSRFGLEYLRTRKLQPKSALQAVIQLALRKHYGHTVSSFETVSVRHFKLGRLDGFCPALPAMEAFCNAAEDAEYADVNELRRLYQDAVTAHSKLLSLITWGRGWFSHILALKEVYEEGDGPPLAIWNDPLMARTFKRKAYTLFMDANIRLGTILWYEKDTILVWIRPYEDRVEFMLLNGNDRGEEFIENLKESLYIVRPIIAGIKCGSLS